MATVPLTTPLRIWQPTAGPLWTASQLVLKANQRPAERAVVTSQKGEWRCSPEISPTRSHSLRIVVMLSGVQGGGVAAGGLRPGDGTHQQTD